MSFFLNTGCFVSNEFKNQTNFSYFLTDPVKQTFEHKSYFDQKRHFDHENNFKKFHPFILKPPPGFPSNNFKINKPPDIITTDLNKYAPPFSPGTSPVNNFEESLESEKFFDFENSPEILLETMFESKRSTRRKRYYSPRSSPRTMPIKIIYRKKEKDD